MSPYIINTIPETKKHIGFLIFLGIILIQTVFIIIFAYYGLIPILLSAIFTFLFVYTFLSVKRYYFLVCLYFSIFPAMYYLSNFPDIPVGFVWYIGYPLFLLLIFYWMIHIMENKYILSLTTLDVLLILFGSSLFLSAALGYLKGYDREYWLYDFMNLSLYITYFVVLYSPLKNMGKQIFGFISVCAVIISLQFLDAIFKFGGIVILTRIVSEHIHLSQLAFPYIALNMIYTRNKLKKFIFAIAILLIFVGIIISQQRAMWGSTFVMTFILAIIAFYRIHLWLKLHIVKIITAAVIIFIGLTGLFFVVNTSTQGQLYTTLISRGLILFNPVLLKFDESAKVRMHEISDAIDDTKNEFLIGKGLGASLVTRWRFVRHSVVDNSFVFLYWKMGLWGLFTFLSFYLYFFLRGWRLLKKKLSLDERCIVESSLLNFLGLFIIALTNVCIVHYRFILIWATMIAIVESIARKYD